MPPGIKVAFSCLPAGIPFKYGMKAGKFFVLQQRIIFLSTSSAALPKMLLSKTIATT